MLKNVIKKAMKYSLITGYSKCHIMKLKNTFLFIIVLSLFLINNQEISAQTSGLIFENSGILILDNNSDGYVSLNTAGFISNDLSESEIGYIPIPVLEPEPDSDPVIGPFCSYNDIVDSGSDDPVLIYFDGTNLLFRFRVSGTASNAKGYSILVDSDQKFGFCGSEADPNAKVGNPGFEFEIVLETGVGVGLYNVDGLDNAVLSDAASNRPYNTHAQKSIAYSTICGNPDYFYDFYVPLADLSAFGVNSTTPLRFVGATVMDHTAFIGSSLGSDIAGTDEFYFDDIFECIPPIKISEIGTANTDCRTSCPSVNTISDGATTVTGTSTEQNGTLIEVFKNGGLIGTANVSAGTWSLSGISPALTSGDEIKATAKDGSRYVSFNDCDIEIVGSDCTTSPYNLNIEGPGNNGVRGDITAPSGTLITLYNFDGTIYSDANFTNPITTSSNNEHWKIEYIPSSGGVLPDSNYYVTAQTSGQCESDPAYICVGYSNTSSVPVITTDPVLTTTTIIDGTGGVSPGDIYLFNGADRIGSSVVLGDPWSVNITPGSIAACDNIFAIQIETGKCYETSTLVDVKSSSSYYKPIITGDYCIPAATTVSTVTGTSSEEENSVIDVLVNGSSVGTTLVSANGTWELTGLSINIGDLITAQVISGPACLSESELSDIVTVSQKTQNTATITGTYTEGQGSVSGSGTAGRNVYLYQDGVLIGQSTSVAPGQWTIGPLNTPETSLYAGGLLTVTEIASGLCESDHSAPPDTVQCSPPAKLILTPVQTEYCENENAEIIVGSSEDGVVYTPISVFNGLEIGSSLIGNGADLTLTTYPLTNDTAVTVKAEKLSGISCETYTDTVSIQINSLPDDLLNVSPSSANICRYDSVDITINGAEAGVTYQLQNAADDSNIGLSAVGDGTNPLTISTGPLDTDITIKVNATNYNHPITNCSVDLINTVDITVSGALNNQNVTVDNDTICQNNSTLVNISTDNDGFSYQLRRSSDNSTVGSSFSGDGNLYSISTGNLTADDTFYVEVDNGAGCIISVLDEETVVVNACERDIFLEKTVDDNTPDEGQIITYTVIVTNKDLLDDVTNLVVTDVLPAGLTFGSAITSAGSAWNAPDWSVHPLSAGESDSLKITATVNAGTGGTVIRNIISNTQYETDNNLTDDLDTLDIYVNNDADIVLTKTVNDNAPDEGQTITYTVTVTNNGPAQAQNLIVTDALPAGLTLVNGIPTAGSWSAPNWTVGTLDNGATETLTITATVDAGTGGTTITNTVSNSQNQTDLNNTPDDNNEAVTVNNDADIVLTKTVNDNTPDEGQTITYTVTVTNNGPAQTKNLVLTDALPAGLTLVNAIPSSGSWVAPNWTVGTLDKGATETLTITATVDVGTGGTTITNTVSKAHDQTDLNITSDDNNEPITVNNNADIVLTKVADISTPNEGQNVTFTVTVTNNGPAQVHNLVVTDVLPAGLTFVSGIPTAGTWTSPNWTVGILDNGATETIDIIATVNAGTGGTSITNTVSNAQDQTDLNTTTDDDNEVISVNNDADIVLTKTVDDGTPDEGQTITYTITVTNNGAAQATNLIVTDVLPAGISFVSATPTVGTWSSPNWTIGTLNNGDTETISITATVDVGSGGTTITNTISNTQDQADNNSTSDDNVEDIIVNNDADIVLTKVTDNPTPNAGDNITFTITVTNNGPAQAQNLIVSDLLPAGLTLVSGTPTTGTWTSPDWTIGTLNSGVTETLIINADVDVGTNGFDITNTVSNSQEQTDTNISTDDDNEIIYVNDIPVANDDNETTDEDNTLISDVLINDTGLSDGGIVVTLITDVINGILELNADGTFTYTPDADYYGSDSFVYEVCDTENDCNQATVFITINSVNDLPAAQDDDINVDEDSELNEIFILNDNGNGSDYFGGDGPGIGTVGLILSTENGTLEFNDNSTPNNPTDDYFIYTPEHDYFGYDSFEYEICDSDGDCDQAIVNIEVINDNVLFFPKIFTPNNDGFNDRFYIEGLEIYPENTIIIFNRWGNKVFEASPYNNDWDGTANFGIKFNGKELPEGTYFFILKTGNDEKDIKAYIYLKR